MRTKDIGPDAAGYTGALAGLFGAPRLSKALTTVQGIQDKNRKNKKKKKRRDQLNIKSNIYE